MEKEVIFKGAGVAIATPFYENGNGINYDELARLIDFNLNKCINLYMHPKETTLFINTKIIMYYGKEK